MKLTKYAQSCFLVETAGKKVLIDPGNYVGEETIKNFRDIDFLLYTHIHNDHCSLDYTKIIVDNNNLEIFCNQEVADKLSEFKVNVVKAGDVRERGNIRIKTVKAVHGYHVKMRLKNFPKEANGFIVRDEKTSVYHCGDTVCFYQEFKADVVLVPICGNAVVMEPHVAVDFCKEMKAKLTIPTHYDGPKHPIKDTKLFEKYAQEKSLNYKVLKKGESIEV